MLRRKLIYQELNRKYPDIGWDEPLPEDVSGKWRYFVWQLDEVRNIAIPCWFMQLTEESVVEIHVMCDTSKVAYGAVVYIVVQPGNHVSFVMAESWVI